MTSPRDHYKTLAIHSDATTDEIKAVFRRSILANHPDKVSATEVAAATARSQAINNAYEVLKDPERRRKYDRTTIVGGPARLRHAPSQPDRERHQTSEWGRYGHDDEWLRRTKERADARARRRREEAEDRERRILEQAREKERQRRWREADRERYVRMGANNAGLERKQADSADDRYNRDAQRAAEALRENVKHFIPRAAVAEDTRWQPGSNHNPFGAVSDEMEWDPPTDGTV